MNLRGKLEAWMDCWVGTASVTVQPEAMIPSSGSVMQFVANPNSTETPKSGSRIHMQDVFFLEERTEKQRPRDTVALYLPDREVIAVRHPDTGEVDHLIPFRNTRGLIPLWGCFGESGDESVALYDPESGTFRVWESLDHTEPRDHFLFGPSSLGWIPLIGDWDGDGRDGIGLYCPETSTFLLKNSLESGDPDHVFMFGAAAQGWIPVTGDWDGDDRSGIGLYDPQEGVFFLRNELQGGEHEFEIRLASNDSNLIPMAGDWLGNGQDEVALFDLNEGVFHLGMTESIQTDWTRFAFGSSQEIVQPLRMKWSQPLRDAEIGEAG